MTWIKLKDAIKMAGVTKRTAYNHIKNIRENQSKHQRKLIRKVDGQIEVLAPQAIVHFQTDLRKLKKARVSIVDKHSTTYQDKRYSKSEEPYYDVEDPLLVSIFPQVREILERAKKKSYEKLWKCVLICDEYMIGLQTLDNCCRHQGLDPSTFWFGEKNMMRSDKYLILPKIGENNL